MNNSSWAFTRAIRGPILLITLGGLMALDQIGGLSFSKTWPVLVIVFGCLKLAERAAYRSAGFGPPPPQGPSAPPPPPDFPGFTTPPQDNPGATL